MRRRLLDTEEYILKVFSMKIHCKIKKCIHGVIYTETINHLPLSPFELNQRFRTSKLKKP